MFAKNISQILSGMLCLIMLLTFATCGKKDSSSTAGDKKHSSLSDMTELKAALPFGSAIGAPFDVSSFNTGFVVLNINGSNPSAFTANKLTITLDDSVPQLYAMDMDPASEAAGYLETHLIAWEEGDNTVENPDDNSEEIIDEYQLLLEKLEDPNVIMSDIVAGIDHSSIIKDGDTTFFSSVMSDGSVVRFEQYEGAYTMNDLVPYAYPAALGQVDTLVVPVAWADQTDMANDNTMNLFRQGIGRIVDAGGNVTDYSVTDDEKFSLSEYYDLASYGKMTVTSFMTDWYYSEQNFSDVWMRNPDGEYANDIMDWVRNTYPDMDWSKYDKDGNGYIDSMIILNAGVPESSDEMYIISYSGAICYRQSYYGDYAGTQDAPRVNTFTTVGYNWIQDDYSTIIHEFAHGLGLIDYYDVTYSGIDAVGSLDMPSGSYGDWNSYSKLAVGWMNPTIVEGLASGESVEYTIGSSSLTDDVIIIPASGTKYDGPFGEYVMIDLLTMDGANKYGTELFGLEGVKGIRISHVNAAMEKRTMEVESKTTPGSSEEYTIGTIHYANNYKASDTAKYNIEVIQAGGDNTFTDIYNLDTTLAADDLFYAGDSFSAEAYDEFFYNGLMDDGSAFGYIVEIVNIGTDANGAPQATIRIKAK